MHDAQSKDSKDTAAEKPVRHQRPFKFYAVVKHRQVDLETNLPKRGEVLEFNDKASMRAALEAPAYETAEIRIIRGYELTVKAKRNISIN